MKLTSAELMNKARASLDAAKILDREGFAEFAAARAYYTMFYVAQAFLLTSDLSFSKHSSVIAAFGKEFIKTGEIDPKFHRYLIDAQEIRLIADYRGDVLSQVEAQLQIERAEEFITVGSHLSNSE